MFNIFRRNKVEVQLTKVVTNCIEIGFKGSIEELRDYIESANKLDICFKIDKKNIGTYDYPVWVYYFSLIL